MTHKSTSLIETEQTSLLFDDDQISIVSCPEKLNSSFVSSLGNDFEELIKKQPFVLLELEKTSFIDSLGLEWLIKLSKLASQSGGGLYLKGLRAPLIRFLKLNRIWDLFNNKILNNIRELNDISKINTNNPAFYPIFEIEDHYTVIHLFGRLDAGEMNRDGHSAILKHISENHCILDLKNLTFIDSTGLTLFIKILRLSSISQKQCILCGLNNDIRQMFIVTKLINLFTVVADFTSAHRKIVKIK